MAWLVVTLVSIVLLGVTIAVIMLTGRGRGGAGGGGAIRADDGAGGGGGGMSVAEAVRAVAAKTCSEWMSCPRFQVGHAMTAWQHKPSTDSDGDPHMPFTEQECADWIMKMVKMDVDVAGIQNAVDDGTVKFNVDEVDNMQPIGCNATEDVDPLAQIFVGNLKDGQACDTNYQCQSADCRCDNEVNTCTKECQPVVLVLPADFKTEEKACDNALCPNESVCMGGDCRLVTNVQGVDTACGIIDHTTYGEYKICDDGLVCAFPSDNNNLANGSCQHAIAQGETCSSVTDGVRTTTPCVRGEVCPTYKLFGRNYGTNDDLVCVSDQQWHTETSRIGSA